MNAWKIANEFSTEFSELIQKSYVCALIQYASNSVEAGGTCGLVQTKWIHKSLQNHLLSVSGGR